MSNEQARAPKFWDVQTEERLQYTGKDEAISSILSELPELPYQLEICGFAPLVINNCKGFARSTLEELLNTLDENYGDPDGDSTEPTDEMLAAADEFARKVIGAYRVWQCEIVEREMVDVTEWVRKHCPTWLDGSACTPAGGEECTRV